MPNEEENCVPPMKRQRIDAGISPREQTSEPSPDLGERLRFVMLCNVCHEVPHPEENHQCTRGHIICDECCTRILAEAVLRNKEAKCPQCRVRISWPELSTNLILKQALWELPSRCGQCDCEISNKSLAHHIQSECRRRQVACQYRCLGCDWRGSYEDCAPHEAFCTYPHKSADEILEALLEIESRTFYDNQGLRECQERLSAQRVFFFDVELSFRRQSGQHRLLLESMPISAFEELWQLRLRISPNTDRSQRKLSYSLMLMTVPKESLYVSFFVNVPDRADTAKQLMDIEPLLHKQRFRLAEQSSGFKELTFRSPDAIYRLLAMQPVCLRLWIFMNTP
ncbi:cysteine and histidine-rich protein 1 homolog [Scaptodrosophila lebanonensis]|uniref:Cysteine and histidine-rich protein 1 homolog n=1 Tax=Drosophila lebanonensis TaxID=7225 RepID=A0A6J2UGD9_DROLE|nr:cysteine and histidine-rich protein 1 homolog [Scaptodrosophila lebanonensis]